MENQLLNIKQQLGRYSLPLIAMLFALIFLYPSLNNGFVNWDDTYYIINNDLIKDLSLKNIGELFTDADVLGSYSPITHLSWAIDYAIAGLTPWMFHFTNLVFHLLNMLLVFVFILKLAGRNDVALICTLLFGLHPMNIEVVAWTSARKDLVYTFFYLLSLIAYLKFNDRSSKSWYWFSLSLVLFILSLFAKGMAITLPLILLLIDYFKSQKNLKKILLEKVPYLFLAIAFAVVGFLAQQDAGAMTEVKNLDWINNFFIAGHNTISYLFKSIIPIGLSAYYPPPSIDGENLPWYFYAAIVPVVILFYFIIKLAPKHRIFGFGILFFLISIAPVIQLLPFGMASFAERFSYLAYLGLFFILSFAFVQFISKLDSMANSNYLKKGCWLLLGSIIMCYGTISNQRIGIWKDGDRLWTSVIEQYPQNEIGYSNRAEFLGKNGEHDQAIKDLKKSIECNPKFYQGYNNLGFAYNRMEAFEKTIPLLNEAIKLNATYDAFYTNRAIAYKNLNQNEKALADFNSVINYAKEEEAINYYNRGNLLSKMGQHKKGLIDLNRSLKLDYNDFNLFRERGKTFLLLNQPQEAMKDLNKCIQLNKYNTECYYFRGSLHMSNRSYQEALMDFSTAIKNDPTYANAYLNRGLVHMNLGNYEAALRDYLACEKIDPKWNVIALNKGILFYHTQQYQKALNQFSSGIQLFPNYGSLYYHRAKVYQQLNNPLLQQQDLFSAKKLGFTLNKEEEALLK